MKFALIIVLLFIMISTSHAIQPEIGDHTIHYSGDGANVTVVSDLDNYNLAVQKVSLLDIYLYNNAEINVYSDVYYANINLTKVDKWRTLVEVKYTDIYGITTSTNNTILHIESILTSPISPIYVFIGTTDPFAGWPLEPMGITGVLAAVYQGGEIDDDDLNNVETYYDEAVPPATNLIINSNVPLTISYTIQTEEYIYGIPLKSTGWLGLVRNIPFLGPPIADSISAVIWIAVGFVSLLVFTIFNWAIVFLLFETFVLAHAIMMVRAAETPLAGIVDAFMVIATDNLAMLRFVIDAIVLIIGWFIQIATNIKPVSYTHLTLPTTPYV